MEVTVLRGDAVVGRWLVDPATAGGLGAAESLARLVLLARRYGGAVALEGEGPVLPELLELLELVGLVPVWRGGCLRIEVRREPEDREESGVDEVVVADDPVL